MEALHRHGALTCPVCGSTEIVQNDAGDFVCSRCGFVVLEARDVNFDFFEGYGSDNKPISSRSELLEGLHDRGLGSVIDHRESKGFRGRRKFREIARLNDRIKFTDKKSSFVGDVKKGIEEYASLIARVFGTPLPKYILMDAHKVAHSIFDLLPPEYRRNSIEFRRKVGLATLLAVIKEYGSYLPPEVIINKLELDDPKQIKDLYSKVHHLIVKNEMVKVKKSNKERVNEIVEVILNFLSKVMKIVNVPRETLVLEVSSKILNAYAKAKKNDFGNKHLSSYAAATLYLALRILALSPRNMVTQEALAKAIGRGTNAIRNAYADILDSTLIIVEVPAKPRRNKMRVRRKEREKQDGRDSPVR